MNDMYHITADRKKRKYGYVSNLIYYMKEMKAWNKWMFFCVFLEIVPQTIANYLGALLPASLVKGLEQHSRIPEILLPLFVITAILLICNMASATTSSYYFEQYDYFPLHFMKKYVSKVMDIDYERLEDKNFKTIMDNAWGSARFGNGINRAVEAIPALLTGVVTLLMYGIILGQRNLLILVLAIISVVANLYLLSVARKMHGKYFSKISKYSKGEEYITGQCMDSAAGKDIRIYKMLDYILKKYDENLNQLGNLYGKIHNWYLFRNLSGAVLEFIRDSVAFALLGYYLVQGSITAAEFVFYIGIFSGFSQSLEHFIRNIMNLNAISTSISYIREFDETESVWKEDGLGEEEVETFRNKAIKLELRNVTFTYQGNEEPTIKDLSITIKPGEKLALIGLNGAGKTTLVKLICGLYMPEKGEILLNDKKMDEYTREEYFSLITVLFQDTTLLPLSVDENITAGEGWNEEHLKQVIKISGFAEKYESLPRKGATKLIKKIEETAVDFSGGEKQKLLFARALYKRAPLVILDEPTAALDPIAENELYVNFGTAMENRTSIYISHRLSSTRFCDRIILLEHGRIIEEGTHESLLAAGGRYANLFDMQSQYYKEQEERKKRNAIMEDEYVVSEKGGLFVE